MEAQSQHRTSVALSPMVLQRQQATWRTDWIHSRSNLSFVRCWPSCSSRSLTPQCCCSPARSFLSLLGTQPRCELPWGTWRHASMRKPFCVGLTQRPFWVPCTSRLQCVKALGLSMLHLLLLFLLLLLPPRQLPARMHDKLTMLPLFRASVFMHASNSSLSGVRKRHASLAPFCFIDAMCLSLRHLFLTL